MSGESATAGDGAASTSSTARLDDVTRDLQRLRLDAGGISYAEIALRVGRLREARGLSPERARVARSSVFDAFREGRARLNADLVADIAAALGADAADADAWRRRVAAAQAGVPAPEPSTPTPGDQRLAPTPPPTASIALDPDPGADPWLRRALVGTLLAGSVFMNLSGGALAQRFDLPVFLDMIGTAVVAIVLGPWLGAGVGVVTNLLGTLTATPETILFALVNVAGALVWGYGVRRIGGRHPLVRFAALSVCAGAACALVAVPITLLIYGELSGHGTDPWIVTLVAEGVPSWVAVSSTNLAASMADKLIAGAAALLVAVWLAPVRLRADGADPTAPFRRST